MLEDGGHISVDEHIIICTSIIITHLVISRIEDTDL